MDKAIFQWGLTFIYQKMQNIHFYSITLTDDIEFQAFKLNRGFAYIFVDCRSVTTIVRIVLNVKNMRVYHRIARLMCELCEISSFCEYFAIGTVWWRAWCGDSSEDSCLPSAWYRLRKSSRMKLKCLWFITSTLQHHHIFI